MKVITAVKPGEATYYDPFAAELSEGEIDQSDPLDPQSPIYKLGPLAYVTADPSGWGGLKWSGYRAWLPEHKDHPATEIAKQTTPSILNNAFYEVYDNFHNCFVHQKNLGNPDPFTGCEECAERGVFGGLIITKAQRKGNLALDWILSNTKDPSSAVNPEVNKAIAEGQNAGPGMMETIHHIKTAAPKTVGSFFHGETKLIADTTMAAATGAGTGVIDGLVGAPAGLGGAYDAATSAVQNKLGVDLGINERITGGLVLGVCGVILLMLLLRR